MRPGSSQRYPASGQPSQEKVSLLSVSPDGKPALPFPGLGSSGLDASPDGKPVPTFPGLAVVDETHLGRHVTGLERITRELFSAEALSPLPVKPVTAKGMLDMIVTQSLLLPWQMLRDRKTVALCAGFPPTPLLTLLGERVLPYIHDVFLLTRPQDLNWRAKLYMRPSLRLALKRLPRFLANSQHTCEAMRPFCRADAEIHLYRPRVRNVFSFSTGGRANRALPGQDIRLLALGTVEPRKNLIAAAHVVAALRAKGHAGARLDLVGRVGWGPDAEMLKTMPGVTMHGYLDQEAIRILVGQADALICTSHDEGLGLPLLEAQYAGLPVIAPDAAVFREVLGQSGILIDPADPATAAQMIAARLGEAGMRARFIETGLSNLVRWNALAEGDHACVLSLIGDLLQRRAA
jgi:glycosyltransferase involved in cell wall biosynthesis